MSELKENPYEPATVSISSSGDRPLNWQRLRAFIFLLIGLAAIGFTAIRLYSTLVARNANPPEVWLLMGSLGVAGVLWIIAAICLWSAKDRSGFYIAVFAFAIVVIIRRI